ncbi:hypothetical protein Tco_0889493 [Tanacetum coccineum]
MSHHKRIYVTPSHTKKIFGNMKMEGKGFSRRVTPLFLTMMKKQKPRKPKRKDIEIPQSSGPTEPIAYKAANEENVPTNSNDPLLSGEDSLKLHDLMEICTNLQQRVLDLENTKTTKAQEISSLKLRGRFNDEEIFDAGMLKGDEVFVAEQSEKVVEEVVNTATTKIATTTTVDEEMTLAQTLIEIKSAKPKVAKVVIKEPEQGKEEQTTYQSSTKKYHDWKPKDLKNKSFANIQELFEKAMKRVNTFVDMDTELVEGSETRAQESSLKRAVPEDADDIAIDAIPLATKPPSIIDWKISKEDKKSYYQIIRSFDREDLETLWKLVKARFKSTKPVEDLELMICWDLKIMFEPLTASEVWKNQLGNKVLISKLIDSCGVHFVRMQSMHIYMLVDKRYPLKPSTITKMFNKRLQADNWNEMCYQLLKLLTKQLKGQ